MGKGRALARGMVSVLIVSACMVSAVHAAGPWKGQIVDAQTGEPLEGVVVLVVWLSYAGTFGGWAGAKYFDSEEVVTGSDGRFVISDRRTFSFWFRAVKGPEVIIFKPGYGQWQFQGQTTWPSNLIEQQARIDRAWKGFENDGVVFELPRLKTREERLNFYQSPGRTPPAFVPRDRMRGWQEAEHRERAFLGFHD